MKYADKEMRTILSITNKDQKSLIEMEATFYVNNMEKFIKECTDKIPFDQQGEIT